MAKTKFMQYFDARVTDDKEDIIKVGETSAAIFYDRFKITIGSPEMYVTIWSVIFESILDKLVTLERTYSDFQLDIAQRLSVGFTSSDNEDDEKVGNFMVFIDHIGVKPDDAEYDPTVPSKEKVVQWNMENIIEKPKIMQEISTEAVKKLKDYDIQLGNPEFVFPLFIVFYETLVNYVKIRKHEVDEYEYEINSIWFSIGAREGEDGLDEVYIRPTIASKLALKNDAVASSKYE